MVFFYIKKYFVGYFDLLSDEVILHIFRWLPKMHLRNLCLVSRRFYRLTQDESLWTRMDISNRLLEAGVLGKIISKQMIILRLSRSEVKICYLQKLFIIRLIFVNRFKNRLLHLIQKLFRLILTAEFTI